MPPSSCRYGSGAILSPHRGHPIGTADTIAQAPSRAVAAASAVAATRLVSLDAFRGLTIAGMILVNNPGSWAYVYWPLGHAKWNGWTPTDLIFPFFVFIAGVSMVLSFAKRLAGGATRGALALHVIQRSVIIFAVGLFLAGFPYFHLATIRIPGVLQRIAVCYLFAGLIVLASGLFREREETASTARGIGQIAAILVVLLVGYWALMTFVPVPGYGTGRLDPDGNLGAYLDRKLLAGHLWSQSKTWDPEGILSTIPAIGTALAGVLVGVWLRSRRTAQIKAAGLLAAGAAGLVLGELLHSFFPINKNLWTSTYVVFTGGFAMLLLGLCYWVMDIWGRRRWAAPLLVFGANPLAAYALSSLLAKASVIWHVTRADGRVLTWHGYVYNRFFQPLASPYNASLAFAVSYVLLWLALMWILYWRRVFIKI